MTISFPAPTACQFADEELMLEIASVVFPDCLRRWPGENGLRIWVTGDHRDPVVRDEAIARFQTVLGILRAWRADAGELREEVRAGLGEGSVKDEHGNTYVLVGTATLHVTVGGKIESFALQARHGIEASQNLGNALWLNGRMNRTAADYYMIHEYAEKEFGGTKGIRDKLGLTVASQSRLTMSANRLSPVAGGRHAGGDDDTAYMSLDEQREYVSELLRLWIATYRDVGSSDSSA